MQQVALAPFLLRAREHIVQQARAAQRHVTPDTWLPRPAHECTSVGLIYSATRLPLHTLRQNDGPTTAIAGLVVVARLSKERSSTSATGGEWLTSPFMLESAVQQQTAISTWEEHDFVTAVRDRIVHENPRLGDDPALFDRLAKAYGEAKRIGLTRDELIEEFLYLEALVPSFYHRPEIAEWLEKHGAPADDRFNDLLDLARRKLEQSREGC